MNPSNDEEKTAHLGVISRPSPPPETLWSHRTSSGLQPNSSIREPWDTGPDERRNGTANAMLEPPREKTGRPSRREREMKMASSTGRDNTPPLDISEDQWAYMKFPEVTPTPAARQSSARVDMMQRERSPIAATSNPWSISLKSTISEDLSRQDKDQGAKLRYLQKRLDGETLKSLHGGGPQNHDATINFTASRKGPYRREDWDQLFGLLMAASGAHSQ